jgi:hypothetical protein
VCRRASRRKTTGKQEEDDGQAGGRHREGKQEEVDGQAGGRHREGKQEEDDGQAGGSRRASRRKSTGKRFAPVRATAQPGFIVPATSRIWAMQAGRRDAFQHGHIAVIACQRVADDEAVLALSLKNLIPTNPVACLPVGFCLK